MNKPRYYEIRVESHLGVSWSNWFRDLAVRYEQNGQTVFCGMLPDQSALYGMLAKIRDLNLVLVSVNQIDCERIPLSEDA